MSKEFNNNEIAYLKNAVTVDFVEEGVAISKELGVDCQVKIIKSKKLPKSEGSIGYYVSIKYIDREVGLSSPIPEYNFYTKMQWDKKLKMNELKEEFRKYIVDNIKIELKKNTLEIIYGKIENSLITELLEGEAWKVISNFIFEINKNKIIDNSKISDKFDELLDESLPF